MELVPSESYPFSRSPVSYSFIVIPAFSNDFSCAHTFFFMSVVTPMRNFEALRYCSMIPESGLRQELSSQKGAIIVVNRCGPNCLRLSLVVKISNT